MRLTTTESTCSQCTFTTSIRMFSTEHVDETGHPVDVVTTIRERVTRRPDRVPDLMADLDRLGVSHMAGADTIRERLRGDGIKVGNGTIARLVRARKASITAPPGPGT